MVMYLPQCNNLLLAILLEQEHLPSLCGSTLVKVRVSAVWLLCAWFLVFSSMATAPMQVGKLPHVVVLGVLEIDESRCPKASWVPLKWHG